MLIGYITKEMFNNPKVRTLRSPADLKVYTVPLDAISCFDVGRKVFLNDAGEVEIESMKAKIKRSKELFDIEKIENRPIINIDAAGEYIEPKTKFSEDDAEKVNNNVIE